MEQAYAQALWRAVSGGMKPATAVSSLKQMLQTHGRMSLLPRIGKAFARIAAREEARTGIVLTVARESDERRAHSQIKDLLKEMDAEMKDVEAQVDTSLIGGWRLEGRERLIDASHKKALLTIYNRVTK